jgi:putative FmdB family regulatory protein
MPLYEYKCEACGQRFELIQRFSDPPADTCAVCGSGPVRKLLSSPAIQFKGSGWYITDYAKKGEAKADSAKDKPAKAAGDSADKSGSKTEKNTTSSAAGSSSTKE